VIARGVMLRPVRPHPLITFIVASCVAGCGGGCSGAGDDPGSSSGPRARHTEASGDEAPREEAPVDHGPPPVVRIAVEVDPHGRSGSVRVENRGTERAEIAPELVLERRSGSAWENAGASIELRDSCEVAAERCITLAPGAVFLPPEWLGTIGDAQCACERCVPAETGTYRFRAQSCGGHAIEGEPFEVR
jgi:hypothetical protein